MVKTVNDLHPIQSITSCHFFIVFLSKKHPKPLTNLLNTSIVYRRKIEAQLASVASITARKCRMRKGPLPKSAARFPPAAGWDTTKHAVYCHWFQWRAIQHVFLCAMALFAMALSFCSFTNINEK